MKKMNTNKQKALIGAKKASTLLKKIVSMIEKDKYCVDIMQQNLAVIGLLKSVNLQLMEGHLNTCFTDAIMSDDKDKRKNSIDEILKVTKLSNK